MNKCDIVGVDYSSCVINQINKDKIDDIFDKALPESDYYYFKRGLAFNNGRFSSEKIAEVCNKVIGSVVATESNDNDFKIKYKTSELKYDHNYNRDIGIDPAIFIKIFKDIFKIDLKIGEDQAFLEGTIDKNNLYRCSKLICNPPSPIQKNLSSHFLELYKRNGYVDVSFSVEDKVINAHQAVLSQCPYFDKLFNEKWKDCKERKHIPFQDYSFKALNAFITYLYSFELDDKEESIPFYLEMLKLVDYVQYVDLKPILIRRIDKILDKTNFIHLAASEYEDPTLDTLLRWFLVQYSEDKEMDFSQYPVMTIFMLNMKAKEYGLRGTMYQTALKEIAKRIDLNPEFIILCKEISNVKDTDAKKVLVKALKGNLELFKKLKEGNEGEYQDHWKAFQIMLNDFSF